MSPWKVLEKVLTKLTLNTITLSRSDRELILARRGLIFEGKESQRFAFPNLHAFGIVSESPLLYQE